MVYFLLSLVSLFVVTFVTALATALVKRLFDKPQKPLPNTSPNVTVVVIFVYH